MKHRLASLGSALAAVVLSATSGTAHAAVRAWAPASSATIHPGVQTYTNGSQCTSNFVFYDQSSVYIGQAGHCASNDLNTQTNGCEANMLPLGTRVEIQGASNPGTLVYDSWSAMQATNESDENACNGNDFALVKIDTADVAKVNPSVPSWGGPNGVDGDAPSGESVYTYGNSELRLGLAPISPMFGYSLGPDYDGWSYIVVTATPGIPGDSGSGYLGGDGGALGVFSTLSVLGYDNITNLSRALDYMRSHSSLTGVQLADGTVRF